LVGHLNIWKKDAKWHKLVTSGFVQLGHDVETIIGCAYPGFGFGGRNSAGQQF
jgi:hypothetical protein